MRGKCYAFTEDYPAAIADFTQAIAHDPTSDEAYYNRAVSRTKSGTSKSDLEAIIADYGMVIQIDGNPELRQGAQAALENVLANSEDPALPDLCGERCASGAASLPP